MPNYVERMIVALDVDNSEAALSVCDRLGAGAIFYKIGLQLFLSSGIQIVDALKAKDLKVFLDLKLHDIPHQVSGACREIVRMGVDMMTIQTSGGADMMRAAVKAVEKAAKEFAVKPPILLGVTVLTSLSQERAGEIGFCKSISDQVLTMALLAEKCGLDGVVASPQELKAIREVVGKDFIVVTPGIRDTDDAVQDQQRVMNALEATKFGASYIVVGRPVLKADDPILAATKIVSQIRNALT
jgi:orotidine-5'-phosphate decarboxylase